VVANLTNGGRKVSLSLAGDDEFQDLTTHWG